MEHEVKQIEDIILRHDMEEYQECLKNASWNTFYQMSSMREGLLNWYPFCTESRVLFVSDGYGALVDLLCRSVAEVTVYETSPERAGLIQKRCCHHKNFSVELEKTEKKYDYIVIERTIQTKKELKELLENYVFCLKETGIFLFVCSNRLGMKFWCGAADPLTGEPFGGIREADNAGRLTRKDIIEIVNESEEIKRWKLYYPAPDSQMPQAIYTDAYLPKVSMRDRVIPYYTEKTSLIALEDEISDALISNGLFASFANSFLVECSKSGVLSDVMFAALSTDRGREHGFATVIKETGCVQKKSIHPAGNASLAFICRNAKELMRHGVGCVEQKLIGNAVEMPYINAPMLIDYIKSCFEKSPKKVENIFDLLYEEILKSSEHIEFQNCSLLKNGVPEDEAGVILRDAYIDMIPYNCFYKEGKIIFYDQEFVKKNFPAKYVLFRALRYTYIYISDAGRIIPLQYFKAKYRLEALWDLFEKEEADFIEKNRNYDTMKAFYDQASVRKEDIEKNIKRLQGIRLLPEPKTIQDTYKFNKKKYDVTLYNRDYKLNAVKNVQTMLLKEVIRICEINNFSYCAFYGTLLGAVRHAGFIPWDDDVDIAMPRDDYDRFVAEAPKYLPEYYFLQTPENDAGCFYGGYSKLRDSRTTALELRNEGNECHKGIWIDIIVLDEVLSDENERRIQQDKVLYYQRLLMKKSYPNKRILWDLSQENEAYYLTTSELFTREELCSALHDTMVNYGTRVESKLTVLSRYMAGKKYFEYDAADFEFLIKVPFEDFEIYIPSGYEKVLAVDYGKNYLIYPSAENRKPSHMAAAVFDVSKSYVDYFKENGYNV